jgi:hypothetical protein
MEADITAASSSRSGCWWEGRLRLGAGRAVGFGLQAGASSEGEGGPGTRQGPPGNVVLRFRGRRPSHSPQRGAFAQPRRASCIGTTTGYKKYKRQAASSKQGKSDKRQEGTKHKHKSQCVTGVGKLRVTSCSCSCSVTCYVLLGATGSQGKLASS